jgi:hypothetical protein
MWYNDCNFIIGGVFMRKKIFWVSFMLFLCSACHAYDMGKIYTIGDDAGVPRSVVRALMHEESGGKEDAKSWKVNGYCSRGLFQIYEKPENLNWLLGKFWDKPKQEFNIDNAYDNATVALHYLSWLHRWKGSWYEALIYNCGSHRNEKSCAYARRIINAR